MGKGELPGSRVVTGIRVDLQRGEPYRIEIEIDMEDPIKTLAEQAGARFLLASTSEVYGDPESHPQHEDYRGWVNCTGPRACYDEGKRAAEALAFDYARMGRTEVRVARIFHTYGPMMHPDDGRVVSNLICQALSGKPITIYGDGSQTRSFCYISDLVDGLQKLMEAEIDGFHPVNLGNPQELTVRELADMVRSISHSQAELVYEPLPRDDPRRRKPDITRAREWLGWQPRITIEEGLRRTYRWFATASELACCAAPEPARREAVAAE